MERRSSTTLLLPLVFDLPMSKTRRVPEAAREKHALRVSQRPPNERLRACDRCDVRYPLSALMMVDGEHLCENCSGDDDLLFEVNPEDD